MYMFSMFITICAYFELLFGLQRKTTYKIIKIGIEVCKNED